MQAAGNNPSLTPTLPPFFNPNTFPNPLSFDPNMLAGAVVPMQQGQFANGFPNPYMMGFSPTPQALQSPCGGMYPVPMLSPPMPQPTTEVKPKIKVVVTTPSKEEEVRTSRELIKDFNGSPDSQEYKERAEFLMWKMRCVGGLVPKSEPKNTFEPNLYIALECFAILGGLNNQDYKRFVYDSMIEILGNINGDLKLYSSHAGSLVNICDVLSEHTDISNVQKNNIDVHCKILKTYSLLGMTLLRYSKPQSNGKPLISGFSDEFRQRMTRLICDMEKLNVVQDLDLKAESQFARSCFCLLNVDSNVLLDIACALDNLCGIAAGLKAEDYSLIRGNFIELMKKVTEAKPEAWIDVGIAMRTWGYAALAHKNNEMYVKEAHDCILAVIKALETEIQKNYTFPFITVTIDMLTQLALEMRFDGRAYNAYSALYKFTRPYQYHPAESTFTESRKVWFSGKTRFDALPYIRLKIIEVLFKLAHDYRDKVPNTCETFKEKNVRFEIRNYLEDRQLDRTKINGNTTIGSVVLAKFEEILNVKVIPHECVEVRLWRCEYEKYKIEGPAVNPYNQPKPDPSAKKDKDTTHKVKLKVEGNALGGQPQIDVAAYQYQQQLMYQHQQLMLQQYQQQQMFMYQQAQLGYPAPVAPVPMSPQFNGHAVLQQTPPKSDLSNSSSSTGSFTNSTESSPGGSPTSSSSFPSPASLSPSSSPERSSNKSESLVLAQQVSQMTLAPSEQAKPASYDWLEEEVAKLKDLDLISRSFDLSKREDFTVTAETAKIIVKAFKANGIKEMRFLILKSKEEYLLLGKEFETTECHEQTFKCYREAAKLESDNLKKAALFYKAAGFVEKLSAVHSASSAQISYENAIKADLSYSWAAYKILLLSNKEEDFNTTLFDADRLIKLGVIPDREFLKALGHAAIQKYSAPTWSPDDFTPTQDLVNMQVHYANYLASHAGDQEIREIANKITARITELRARFQGTRHAF